MTTVRRSAPSSTPASILVASKYLQQHAMNDDDLLRRFAALRAPTLHPAHPQAHIEGAARRAQAEDEELERVAEGRGSATASHLAAGEAETGSRNGEEEGKQRRELQRRLALLKGTSEPEDDLQEDDELDLGDDEVEAYLASFSATDPPLGADTLQAETQNESLRSARLDAESRKALHDARPFLPSPPRHGTASDNESDADGMDTETEEEILRRVLDLVRLERGGRTDGEKGEEDEDELDVLRKALEEAEDEVFGQVGGSSKLQENQEPQGMSAGAGAAGRKEHGQQESHGWQAPNDERQNATTYPSMTANLFPETPTGLPVLNEDDIQDNEMDETKRAMDRLLRLSGPTTLSLPQVPSSQPRDPSHTSTQKAGKGKQIGKGYGLPGWNDVRDDDLDSWCCICNKDATLICLGCEGDRYCTECWAEGHGVGGEVGHRTKKLVWGQRRALGA